MIDFSPNGAGKTRALDAAVCVLRGGKAQTGICQSLFDNAAASMALSSARHEPQAGQPTTDCRRPIGPALRRLRRQERPPLLRSILREGLPDRLCAAITAESLLESGNGAHASATYAAPEYALSDGASYTLRKSANEPIPLPKLAQPGIDVDVQPPTDRPFRMQSLRFARSSLD